MFLSYSLDAVCSLKPKILSSLILRAIPKKVYYKAAIERLNKAEVGDSDFSKACSYLLKVPITYEQLLLFHQFLAVKKVDKEAQKLIADIQLRFCLSSEVLIFPTSLFFFELVPELGIVLLDHLKKNPKLAFVKLKLEEFIQVLQLGISFDDFYYRLKSSSSLASEFLFEFVAESMFYSEELSASENSRAFRDADLLDKLAEEDINKSIDKFSSFSEKRKALCLDLLLLKRSIGDYINVLDKPFLQKFLHYTRNPILFLHSFRKASEEKRDSLKDFKVDLSLLPNSKSSIGPLYRQLKSFNLDPNLMISENTRLTFPVFSILLKDIDGLKSSLEDRKDYDFSSFRKLLESMNFQEGLRFLSCLDA